jgi:hypothetical protein
MKILIIQILILVILVILSIFLSYIGFTSKSPFLLAIGTSLIASAIVYLLDILKQYGIINALKQEVNKDIANSGIANLYNKRSVEKYDILMSDANKKIDALGYSLRRFHDTSKHIIEEYQKKKSPPKIRILLIDPDSEFSKEREKIEGEVEGTYKGSIEKLRFSFSKYKFIEVKKIATQLSNMIYRIDDTMFIGPYLYKVSSSVTVTFELEKHGWLFKLYENEFNKLWESAKEF